MSEIKDGGPAFPSLAQNAGGTVWTVDGGMSLRDYMAIHANNHDIAYILESRDISKHLPFKTRSEARYAWADAMLAEREKGK